MGEVHYVVGFMFDESKENILLIRKNRPEFQKGRLNGIGGKVEEGEKWIDAMSREFHEEAGMEIPRERWNELASWEGPGYYIRFYWTVGNITQAKTMTDEQLEIHRVDSIVGKKDILTNLKWLIPLAFDQSVQFITAYERHRVNTA